MSLSVLLLECLSIPPNLSSSVYVLMPLVLNTSVNMMLIISSQPSVPNIIVLWIRRAVISVVYITNGITMRDLLIFSSQIMFKNLSNVYNIFHQPHHNIPHNIMSPFATAQKGSVNMPRNLIILLFYFQMKPSGFNLFLVLFYITVRFLIPLF